MNGFAGDSGAHAGVMTVHPLHHPPPHFLQQETAPTGICKVCQHPESVPCVAREEHPRLRATRQPQPYTTLSSFIQTVQSDCTCSERVLGASSRDSHCTPAGLLTR